VDYDEVDGVQITDLAPPEDISALRVDRRRAFLKTLEATHKRVFETSAAKPLSKIYDQAFDLVASKAARAVFDLEKEKSEVRDRYGRFRFGQTCLMARRLVEAGVPFVQVNWSSHVEAEEDWGDGGWDFHYRHFELTQDRHMWMLDQSLSALYEDLAQRGLLQNTLVVAMGEFGRAPRINEKAGRDHWNQCYAALMAGGGVKGGQIIGKSDPKGETPVERPIKPADVCLSVYRALGIERTDLLGLEAAPEGEAIDELF
jgi:hypothetical protein